MTPVPRPRGDRGIGQGRQFDQHSVTVERLAAQASLEETKKSAVPLHHLGETVIGNAFTGLTVTEEIDGESDGGHHGRQAASGQKKRDSGDRQPTHQRRRPGLGAPAPWAK